MITGTWEKARQGHLLDYRVVNKIICSLEGGSTPQGTKKEALQRCANQDAQKQGTGACL